MRPALVQVLDALQFCVSDTHWHVPPFHLRPGEWATLVSGDSPDLIDPSGPLIRTLFTLRSPEHGTVFLHNQDAYALPYVGQQRLRAEMGFVPSSGGLLSNRTLRDNIALPLSLHARRTFIEEALRVDEQLDRFGLRAAEHMFPHEVNGYTRWRACLARALILSPSIVMLEGLGDWDIERGQGLGWQRLREYRQRQDNAILIALPSAHPEFEQWFQQQGGHIIRYRIAAELPLQGATHR